MAAPARLAILASLSLLNFLLMATTFNSLGLVLPSMVTDLRMSWSAAGLGFTLLGLACGLSSLVPAVLIRRIGVSLTLVAGVVLLIAGFAAFALARHAPLYHGGAILLGLGFTLCGAVPSVHVISGLFERRATALGIYFTAGGMGSVAGPILFYQVHLLTSGWRIYWLLCGGGILVVGLVAALVARGRGERATLTPALSADATRAAVRETLASVQFWVVVAAYTGCLLVNTTLHGFAYQQLLEHGRSAATATALVSLAALIGAGGAAAAGIIGERIDGRRLTMLSLGALVVSSLSLAFVAGPVTVALFVVGMGIGLGFSYVSTAMLVQEYFGRGVVLELYSVMTLVSTAAAAGPLVGGLVRDRVGSFAPVFVGLAAIDLLLLLAVLALRRPRLANPAALAPGFG